MDNIEEIKSKLDIVDVISGYLPLKQTGGNFKARCPFHNEKTPSFMVSREKQIWHCFGCSKGGDLISFVQEHEGISFAETLRLLASKANVTLSGYQSSPREDYSRLYEVNKAAVQFYQNKLQQKNEVTRKVFDYLSKRKIIAESINIWQLGLSGEGWDELYHYLLKQGFKDEEIFQAGIILKKKEGSGYIDRFRKRLMFPIGDLQGRIVAFTSRTLTGIAYDEEDFGGKYINSPQTVIYDKSKVLYGWHLARTAIRQKKYLIIVEGNMDAIAAFQAGTKNVVAVSGTALTSQHVKLIKRYTENVILAFDGDAAGSQAVFRSIALGWKEDLNLKILVLPKGKDPADIIKEDQPSWREAIKNSIPVMDYYFRRIMFGVDLSRSDHKKIAVRKLLPIIKFLKSKVEQAHYLKLLADKLQLPLEILQQDLIGAKSFLDNRESEFIKTTEEKKDPLCLASEHLLALIFYSPVYLIKAIAEIEPEIISPSLQPLYSKVIIYYTKHQHLTHFIDYPELNDEERSDWIKLSLSGESNYSNSSDRELETDFLNIIFNIKNRFLGQERQKLIQQLRQAELSRDTAQQDVLIHKINLLNKEVHKLQR